MLDESISGTSAVSVAHMRSPGGWKEPGQTPEFAEFTLVLKGMLHVEHKDGALDVRGGAGGDYARGRVGAVFDAGAGRRRVHRCVSSGSFGGDGAS